MGERQHVTPMIVRGNEVQELIQVPLKEPKFSEGWLQDLLFDHPRLLPVGEIEEVFDGLVPVAKELPTPAGLVDLVFINLRGWMTLVETKLWSNPGARRVVVAQIIDYAQAMSKWSYDDLASAVQRAGGLKDASLPDLMRQEAEDFDEKIFTDTVSRNLREGKLLLLIVGEGIQESVERMAEFLEKTPRLDFRLALVEMGLYQTGSAGDDHLYVHPRVLARTREVTRAVVTVNIVEGSQVAVDVSLPPPPEEGKRRQKLTEEEFFRRLGENAAPRVVEFARWILDQVNQREELLIHWLETGPGIRYVDPDTGMQLTLFSLNSNGKLGCTAWLGHHLRKAGVESHIPERYKQALANLVPGATLRVGPGKQDRKKGYTYIFYGKEYDLPLDKLAEKRDDLFKVINETVAQVREALEKSQGSQ